MLRPVSYRYVLPRLFVDNSFPTTYVELLALEYFAHPARPVLGGGHVFLIDD